MKLYMAIKNTKQKILPKTLSSPTAPHTRTWLFNFPAWRWGSERQKLCAPLGKRQKLTCVSLRRWVWGSPASLLPPPTPPCGLCLQRLLTPSWEDIGPSWGRTDRQRDRPRCTPYPELWVKVCELHKSCGVLGRGREKGERKGGEKTEKEERGDRDRHEWERYRERDQE